MERLGQERSSKESNFWMKTRGILAGREKAERTLQKRTARFHWQAAREIRRRRNQSIVRRQHRYSPVEIPQNSKDLLPFCRQVFGRGLVSRLWFARVDLYKAKVMVLRQVMSSVLMKAYEYCLQTVRRALLIDRLK